MVVKEYKKENIKSDTKKNTKKPANSQHKNQITIVVNETAILIGCLVAIVAAIALSVAIPVSVGNGGRKPLELLEEEDIASAISFARDPSFAAGVPQNDSPFPVTGPDWPNDGCGDASVRYKLDGKCYPVLRRGPCPNPLHWIAVDPINLSVRFLFITYFISQIYFQRVVLKKEINKKFKQLDKYLFTWFIGSMPSSSLR